MTKLEKLIDSLDICQVTPQDLVTAAYLITEELNKKKYKGKFTFTPSRDEYGISIRITN